MVLGFSLWNGWPPFFPRNLMIIHTVSPWYLEMVYSNKFDTRIYLTLEYIWHYIIKPTNKSIIKPWSLKKDTDILYPSISIHIHPYPSISIHIHIHPYPSISHENHQPFFRSQPSSPSSGAAPRRSDCDGSIFGAPGCSHPLGAARRNAIRFHQLGFQHGDCGIENGIFHGFNGNIMERQGKNGEYKIIHIYIYIW